MQSSDSTPFVSLSRQLFTIFFFLCDALSPSQQFFSHARTISSLPGLNQYQAVDEVFFSRTQHSDSAASEYQTSNPSIPCLMLYQLSHYTPPLKKRVKAGLKLRVRNENLIFLFLNQNICCGYSKEPSQ